MDAAEGNPEDKVFYLKLRADYSRYRAEIFPENDEEQKEEKQKAINEAKEAYEKAREALGPLSLTHPIRLAVFLNLSVFQCEILNDRSEAILTARNAFEDAVKDLAQLPDGQRDDAETIL